MLICLTVGFTRQVGLQRAFLSTAFYNRVASFEFEARQPGRGQPGLGGFCEPPPPANGHFASLQAL